jgi:hypothetical protein
MSFGQMRAPSLNAALQDCIFYRDGASWCIKSPWNAGRGPQFPQTFKSHPLGIIFRSSALTQHLYSFEPFLRHGSLPAIAAHLCDTL